MLLRTWVSFSVLLVSSLSAQEAAVPAAAKKPLRLHVIGASVSGGFRDGPTFGAEEQGDSVTLHQMLKAWAGEHARATTHNTVDMTVMFQAPARIGKAQSEGARKAKPDILLAIDFPFWFAYGHVFSQDEGKARSELLASGLAMLADFEMPVLIGDLPDMQGAAKRMLNPRQIPQPELLAKLNEQILTFVKAHPNFRIVPLAATVQTLKVDGATLPLASGPLQTAPGALLQEDRLHATRLGMALLGFTIQDMLRETFPEDHPLHTQKWTFEQFVEAAGAEGELEVLRAAGKGTEKAKGG